MGTVSKALTLLGQFNRQRPLIGLSDFARLSGMNKATCHRMLTELAEFGFVEKVGSAREYRLGPQVLRLATLREAAVPMRDAAMPILRGMAQNLGETVHLSILVGDKLQMLAFAYGTSHAMAVMMEDADTLPFHATSSGLAVLGFSSPKFRDRMLARVLARLTSKTVTDPVIVRGILSRVRKLGYASSNGGFEAEVDSLAVPLFGADGQCCGALAVAAPTSRLTPALQTLILHEITKGAGSVTALWGGMIPVEIGAAWQQIASDAGQPD